jgi:peptidyl-prolyl cis-trans isomerase SurA
MRWRYVIGLSLALVSAPVLAEKIEIAAIVNDTIITTLDVVDRRDLMLALSGQQPVPQIVRQFTAQSLQALINESLQAEEAKRLSIKVDKKEIAEAIASIEQGRGRPPGSLKTFITENKLSYASLETQLRTQISWSKVVSKRLRRNVTVADEEILRAQQAMANSPGVPQVQIAAISLPIRDAKAEPEVAKLAREIRGRLVNGEAFSAVAQSMVGRSDVRLNPSVWVPEEKLEPSLLAVIQNLEPGQVTEPLRSLNTYQIVYLADRRVIKPAPPSTEIALKQITLSLDKAAPVQEVDTLMNIAQEVRKHPGDCVRKGIAGIQDFEGLKIDVVYLRTKLGEISDELLPLVGTLNVTEVSEPFATKQGIQMLMLCEKIEPASALPDRKQVEQKLFAEKIELEAEKHLRNLKRDAFIEIKFGEKKSK